MKLHEIEYNNKYLEEANSKSINLEQLTLKSLISDKI